MQRGGPTPSRADAPTRRVAEPGGGDGVSPKKRSLTNLYNKRPDWLDLAHKQLDAAVFEAYGWPHDLSDDEILARLLALNPEGRLGRKRCLWWRRSRM